MSSVGRRGGGAGPRVGAGGSDEFPLQRVTGDVLTAAAKGGSRGRSRSYPQLYH